MLAHLLPRLSDVFGPFNVFVYISFRTAGAVVTSLVIAFALGPAVIRRLRLAKVGQVVRDVGPESHLVKSGTPTMGGIIIILATTVSTLLWARRPLPTGSAVAAITLPLKFARFRMCSANLRIAPMRKLFGFLKAPMSF